MGCPSLAVLRSKVVKQAALLSNVTTVCSGYSVYKIFFAWFALVRLFYREIYYSFLLFGYFTEQFTMVFSGSAILLSNFTTACSGSAILQNNFTTACSG